MKAFWLIAYGALCIVSFLAAWALERVEEKLKGPPTKETWT